MIWLLAVFIAFWLLSCVTILVSQWYCEKAKLELQQITEDFLAGLRGLDK